MTITTETLVRTPTSWVPASQLRPGDILTDFHDQPQRLVSIESVGVQPVVELPMLDGRFTEAPTGYLWESYRLRTTDHRVTTELTRKYYFKQWDPQTRTDSSLDFDPFTLGADPENFSVPPELEWASVRDKEAFFRGVYSRFGDRHQSNRRIGLEVYEHESFVKQLRWLAWASGSVARMTPQPKTPNRFLLGIRAKFPKRYTSREEDLMYLHDTNSEAWFCTFFEPGKTIKQKECLELVVDGPGNYYLTDDYILRKGANNGT